MPSSEALTIIEADFVVTMNSDNAVIENGAIAFQAGAIVAVGTSDDVRQQFPTAERISGQHRLLMPGLINSHTHLAMALLRGWAEEVDLQGFLERVWVAEGSIMNPDVVRVGTTLGAAESVLAGTTTTLDMYFHPHAAHEGAVAVGLRHLCGPIFFDFTGLDGLEWEQRLAYAEEWTARVKALGGPALPLYLMPHGTYTVSPDHMREVAALAKKLDANIHIHASENQAENADVEKRYQATPTELLFKAGALDRHVVLGHGVWLSDSDLALLKNGAVAHCPGSNLKLASGSADFYRLRQHVKVGLGTDGCSSSNDLDMWVVMRTAAHLATLVQGSPAKVSALDFVKAATIDAAAALGVDHLVGSLEVGKRADFIRLDLQQPHLTPIHDIFALLVYAAGRGDVIDTYVDGAAVVQNRQLVNVSLEKVLQDARDAVEVLK